MQPITRIKVENFLSLRQVDVRLDPLNVLVGPNGAGKTNLLKVFHFLGDVSRAELAPAVSEFGGFRQLLFRGQHPGGKKEAPRSKRITIEITGVVTQHASAKALDEYRLSFWERRIVSGDSRANRLTVRSMLQRYEELKFKRTGGRGRRITLSGGKVTVANASKSKAGETLQIEGEATGLGTLRRLSQAFGSPQWNSFAELVEQLRLFEIDVEKARRPSPPALSDRLAPDGSNLGWFLLWLKEAEPAAFALVCEDVRFVLPGFEGFDFVTVGGADEAVRVDIKESHLSGATPLAQASFGTIRAIALFAMLHDPNPPRLTCLEEVDHGLHPHALDRLVDRMREASERTQIILATHSPALVNRLDPSELVIVEREEHTGGTRIFRPDLDTVTTLRQRTGYDLGELWFSGALGGAL